nr:hypothetical protein [Halomicroarcula sp. GDY20]
MFRRLRETGPVGLVPLAWAFAAAAHRGVLAPRAVLIAHLVMAGIIAAFTVLSWREMTDGVLLAWRRVLVAGFGVTLLGITGLLVRAPPMLTATVVGWTLVPAAGLAYTGRLVDRRPRAYTAGAGLCVVGVGLYLAGLANAAPTTLAGLAVTGIGQTAGIVAAVVDY